MPITAIHGRSAGGGATHCGSAVTSDSGVCTTDIQKRMASGESVPASRLVAIMLPA